MRTAPAKYTATPTPAAIPSGGTTIPATRPRRPAARGPRYGNHDGGTPRAPMVPATRVNFPTADPARAAASSPATIV